MRPLLSIVMATALAPASALAQRPEPVALAERLIGIGSVVGGEGPFWTADGSRILYAGGGGVWSVARAGGPPIRLAGDIAPQLLRPSPRGDLLAYLSDQSGNPEIWLADASRVESRRLTNLGARINAMSWSPDGSAIAFSALRYGQFDIWAVTVATGQVTRLTSDPRYETYPAWTPDGRTILYVRSDDRWADHDVMAMAADGGGSRVVVSDHDLFDYGTLGTRARFGYPLVSPDGRWVAFRSHRSGWLNYWVVGTAGGPARPVAPEEADQSDARWSPDGREIAFVSTRNGTSDLRTVSATGGAPRVVVPVSLGVAGSPEWSPDGRDLAFTLATPTRPQDLYLVAAAGGAPQRLTASLDPAVERTLVVPEKISYASDDLTIPAYLYRPPSLAPSVRVPGILLIHGGPTGQFSDTYLAQAQFLAAMGYAVLAPNIRGSSGYGKRFEDANNPCWTHCDLRDVVAGVEFLKRLPYVDAGKMGITGNSYGGIMSMGAVAHAPDVFQAAIPQSGYADWISFQDYNAELQHTKLLAYEWGPYPDSAHVYRRNSAIFSAERVTAPVFVLQGEGRSQSWRPAAPIPASLEFVHALDRLNKVVRYKSYPGETYYVTGRANAKQVLLDILGFLDQYLRDGVGRPRAAATSGGGPARPER